MMRSLKWFLVPVFIMPFACATVDHREGDTLQVVSRVDLNRYVGRWYEIARLPNNFEKNLVCTTATYTLKENGKIKVVNEGKRGSREGRPSRATGSAWVPDAGEAGKLKVSFFWPFSSDYWILHLDESDYGYAMVAGSSKRFLWILCREPMMDETLYTTLVESARQMGFQVDQLYRVPQVCD
jgi:apolipoprotein D and lipocalin family protein